MVLEWQGEMGNVEERSIWRRSATVGNKKGGGLIFKSSYAINKMRVATFATILWQSY